MSRPARRGLLLAGLLLAACRGAASPGASTAVPTPTRSPPTATTVPPSATADATATTTTATTAAPSATPRPTVASTATADTFVPLDLVAYYPFDGDARDQSGNDNHGVVIGGVFVADRLGRVKGALRLDGVDDYVEIQDNRSLDLTFEATFALWLLYETPATETFYTLLEKSDPERDGHARYGLWLIGDKVEVCVQPADLNLPQRCLDSEIGLTPGAWHHIAGTSDGGVLRVYVGGQPAGERAFDPNVISQTDFELFIGTDLYNSRVVYTSGTIDDVRVYRRALTGEEIAVLAGETR